MYRYQEIVSVTPFVAGLILGGIGLSVWIQLRVVPSMPGLTLLGLFAIVFISFFARLAIRIDDQDVLMVRFGYLPGPLQRIPLTNVVRATAVSYRPIRQFGGWGIRAGRHDGEPTSVYSLRGTTGVWLELSQEQRISGRSTRHFLIGSLEPERLVAAIGKP